MPAKKVVRRTKETDIALKLDAYGTGAYRVDIPDRWMRHMVETLAKYAAFDLDVRARGDLHHHIDEDVAIALGRTLRAQIRDASIARMGSCIVAMDDALVLVSVDLVDRPFVDVKLPDKMLEHFIRSFALEARITAHNLVFKGENFHHICEATFKGLGKSLRQALVKTSRPMSTKGRVRWK